MVMLKDNHIAVGESIEKLLKQAKKKYKKVEIEVESKRCHSCAKLGASIIMLIISLK